MFPNDPNFPRKTAHRNNLKTTTTLKDHFVYSGPTTRSHLYYKNDVSRCNIWSWKNQIQRHNTKVIPRRQSAQRVTPLAKLCRVVKGTAQIVPTTKRKVSAFTVSSCLLSSVSRPNLLQPGVARLPPLVVSLYSTCWTRTFTVLSHIKTT